MEHAADHKDAFFFEFNSWCNRGTTMVNQDLQLAKNDTEEHREP